MSDLDDLKTEVQKAVDLLASKGTTADEIGQFFKSEDVTGGRLFNDCPVTNWLKGQVVVPSAYEIYTGCCWADWTDANHVRIANWGVDLSPIATVQLPRYILDFTNDHDRFNLWGLDPARSIGSVV